MRKPIALLASLLLAPVFTLQAQNSVDFDVSTTTGDGVVTTIASWSTNPPAQGESPCSATGAPEWAGPKAASGSQDLTLSESATLNISCTWPGDSIVQFKWANATTNEGGSPYTDPKFVRIKYTFAASLSERAICEVGETCVDVPDTAGARPTMRTVTGITQAGTLRARALHINQHDVASNPSNAATKVFTGLVTSTESVGIVVNPRPAAPSSFIAE